MLEDKVLATIKRHELIGRGDTVVVGLSGGPDSLCLFNILSELQGELGIRLEAVHINHCLRPGDADEDERFVVAYCKKLGIKCTVFRGDCNALARDTGKSSEEVGRELRYESYDEVANRILNELAGKLSGAIAGNTVALEHIGASVKIAVAHNANDQAETLLFRLMRGTGTDGLAGMEYSRKSGAGFDIVRPLLDCSREEIEEYIERKGLEPCTDKTNYQPIYNRNKIRLELIPMIQENFNPSIVEALSRLAETAQEDKDYLWTEARTLLELAFLAGSANEIALDQLTMSSAHPSIRHRTILMAFDRIGLSADITRAHIASADELILNGRTGTEINFPHGYVLTISYGRILVRNAEKQMNPSREYENLGYKNAELLKDYSISQMNDTSDRQSNFNSALIVTVRGPLRSLDVRLSGINETLSSLGSSESSGGKITLRTRRDGDYIMLKTGRELMTKKIQDFFTDSKVPAHLRDSIPMLCVGREVLLVLGDDVTGLATGIARSRYTANYK